MKQRGPCRWSRGRQSCPGEPQWGMAKVPAGKGAQSEAAEGVHAAGQGTGFWGSAQCLSCAPSSACSLEPQLPTFTHTRTPSPPLSTPGCKCLERAAVPIKPAGAPDRWLVTLTEVEEAKAVARLLPIMATLIVYNAVYAQVGNQQQTNKLAAVEGCLGIAVGWCPGSSNSCLGQQAQLLTWTGHVAPALASDVQPTLRLEGPVRLWPHPCCFPLFPCVADDHALHSAGGGHGHQPGLPECGPGHGVGCASAPRRQRLKAAMPALCNRRRWGAGRGWALLYPPYAVPFDGCPPLRCCC